MRGTQPALHGLMLAAFTLASASLFVATSTTEAPRHDVARKWNDVDAITLEVLDTDAVMPRARAISALDQAASTWNAIGAGPAIHVGSAPKDADANPVARDGKNRVGFYPGEWPWPSQVGAVTLVWPSTNADGTDAGGIAEVDLAINPAFPWSLDPDGKIGAYDVQNVVTHELGHALGLPDVKDLREATMFFLVLPGETLKRDLTHEDEAMLVKLYDNVDLPAEGCSSVGGKHGEVGATLVALAALAAFRRKR